MPIRMVEDENPQQDNQENQPNDGERKGGGYNISWILLFLPFVFKFLIRRPLLLLAIIAIGAYLWFSGVINFGSGGNDLPGLGCQMKQEVYDKAEVFEPLAPDRNQMPSRVSLEQFAPKRLNQGQQGSCVGWGSAYAARTILESAATGQNPNDIAFSPAYLYNQISLHGCNGSYINEAMNLLTRQGVLPLREFGYSDQDCGRVPDMSQKEQASRYRMRGFNRLTYGGENYDEDLDAIKQNLAAGAPVVIGMLVTNSFCYGMRGQKVWHPGREDYNGPNLGGHCMCVIGYDDNLEGGAFQIMNSWGPDWGQNGIGWVRYNDFKTFNQEAYGLYPMKAAQPALQGKLSCKIGLVNNETKAYIPLSVYGTNIFKTIQPVKKGTRFKIEIKNSSECYVYVFGQETDNSSYVLFPYTKKHSPYCGITGTRLFPKDHSLLPDEIGNKDYMAIVVSKEPIDYAKLNEAVNQSRQANYQAKFAEAFRNTMLQGVRYSADRGVIGFETDAPDKKYIVSIIEMDKQ